MAGCWVSDGRRGQLQSPSKLLPEDHRANILRGGRGGYHYYYYLECEGDLPLNPKPQTLNHGV
jgi:hypothetical protein